MLIIKNLTVKLNGGQSCSDTQYTYAAFQSYISTSDLNFLGVADFLVILYSDQKNS